MPIETVTQQVSCFPVQLLGSLDGARLVKLQLPDLRKLHTVCNLHPSCEATFL